MKIYFLLSALIVITACGSMGGKRVIGNGNITTSEFKDSGFTSIEAGGSIDVYVKQDTVYTIRLVTDENLMDIVDVDVSGSKLNLSIKRNFNPKPTDGIKVYVSSPTFDHFDASGACNFYGDEHISSPRNVKITLSGASGARLDITAPEIDVDLSGAGNINLKGQTKKLTLSGSGSSDLKCGGLLAEMVTVDISGAGKAEVSASSSLDVKISGAGEVRYHGNPSVRQRISGAGSVEKIN